MSDKLIIYLKSLLQKTLTADIIEELGKLFDLSFKQKQFHKGEFIAKDIYISKYIELNTSNINQCLLQINILEISDLKKSKEVFFDIPFLKISFEYECYHHAPESTNKKLYFFNQGYNSVRLLYEIGEYFYDKLMKTNRYFLEYFIQAKKFYKPGDCYINPKTFQDYETMALLELKDELNLDYSDKYQDWPLEISDKDRVEEFLTYYEKNQNLQNNIKFGLMSLILYCLDNHKNSNHSYKLDLYDARIEKQIKKDMAFLNNLILYWCCLKRYVEEGINDHESPEYPFTITPLMRKIWEEYYEGNPPQWWDE